MTARNLTLFDLDGTLISGDSDHAFGEFMVATGWADGDTWRRRNDEFYATYVAGALDVHAYVAFATSVWRNRTPQEQARHENHVRYMMPLEPQLNYLRAAGFEGVDAYWKQLENVIYGGRRPVAG